MTSYARPVLPDPGPDSWWEIELDGDYWDLTLYRIADAGWYNGAVPEAHEQLMPDAVAKDFEAAAHQLLTRRDKASAFIGVYHKKN